MKARLSSPWPAPCQASPWTARFTSFSSSTSQPSAASSAVATSIRSKPGMFGASRTRPVAGSGRSRHAGHGDADPLSRNARRRGRRAAEPGDLVDHCLPAGGACQLRCLADDGAAEVREADAHLGAAEVDRRDESRVRHDLVGDGAAPDMAGGPTGLHYPAGVLEMPHDLGDGLLRKAGLLGDRGPGDRPALENRLHHGPLGELPGQLQRATHPAPNSFCHGTNCWGSIDRSTPKSGGAV